MKTKKRALVVEGGAMRAIYSIGVLDALIAKNYYEFDICIGVSAGATTLASYLAGMHERNYRVTTDYSTRKEFISKRRAIKGGHYMDLDWLWDYCEENDPLDVSSILSRGIEFYVGVTSVKTGEIEYKTLNNNNANDLLKASCALPIAYKTPVNVDGDLYFDGGISDPIPVEEAIKLGASDIVVVRTRKKDFRMDSKPTKTQEFLLRNYPSINRSLAKRSTRYNFSIDLLRSENKDVNIIEINPPDEFKTSRFTKDKEILEADYKLGLKFGEDLIRNLTK